MQLGRRQVDSTAIGIRRLVIESVRPRSDHAAIDDAIVQARTHQRRIVVADAVGLELRQSNELIVMNRCLESVASIASFADASLDRSQDVARLWKWASAISTLAATIVLAVFLLGLPPARPAMAFPSLGDLTARVTRAEQSIWVAAGTGDLRMLREELQSGVGVDARLFDELTPLHIASIYGQPGAAKFLLSRGADVTLTDDENNTALHMAAFLGNTEVVEVLLSAGAIQRLAASTDSTRSNLSRRHGRRISKNICGVSKETFTWTWT